MAIYMPIKNGVSVRKIKILFMGFSAGKWLIFNIRLRFLVKKYLLRGDHWLSDLDHGLLLTRHEECVARCGIGGNGWI